MNYRFLIIIVGLLNCLDVKTQTHYEYWLKLQIEHSIKRWQIGTDLQFRTQANYLQQSYNPFQNQLVYSFRFWTNYKLKKSTILFSPFAYFRNVDFNKDTVSVLADEWRTSVGFLKNLSRKHHEFNFRFIYEHRQFIEHNKQMERSRYLIRWRPLIFRQGQSATQPFIQEEYFLRLDPGKYICDQNRVQIGMKYKTTKLDVSVAYQWTKQRVETFTNRHQLLTSILLTL